MRLGALNSRTVCCDTVGLKLPSLYKLTSKSHDSNPNFPNVKLAFLLWRPLNIIDYWTTVTAILYFITVCVGTIPIRSTTELWKVCLMCHNSVHNVMS